MLGTRGERAAPRCSWPRNERATSRDTAGRYDYLIVGAGFAGSVLAERLASQHGARVLIIDRRPHIGGNAYDEPNEAGILYHKYGPHIFHTNSEQVVDYLSQFTEWRPYEHRVRAIVRGQAGADPDQPDDAQRAVRPRTSRPTRKRRDYLASRAEPVEDIQTSEDVVINAVGRELYELFFHGYTRKQWGLDPSELDKQVTVAHPDADQHRRSLFHRHVPGHAAHGYTAMFENMLDNPLIEVRTGVDFRDIKDEARDRRSHRSTPGRSTNISTSASASCRTEA